MGKKVLLIDSSNRRKNTYNVLLQIEKILKSRGFETEILNLFDYEIKDCVGCEICVTESVCCVTDDMPVIMQKIKESDGLVLSSPVYMSGATSRFKAFADRTNIWVHKPEIAGKPVMYAATTASTGLKEIEKFFVSFAAGFGGRLGDFVGRAGKKMREPVREKEIARFLSLLSQDKSLYSPGLNEIIMFTVGKVLAAKSNGDDRRFWEEKQWMDKIYYYPCNINPFKKVFSKFMLGVLTNAMK